MGTNPKTPLMKLLINGESRYVPEKRRKDVTLNIY